MTDTIEITLPRLIGSRESAHQLLFGVTLKDKLVRVRCRELRSASPPFIDELVKLVLQEGGAEKMIVVSAPPEFIKDVRQSASARDVSTKWAWVPALGDWATVEGHKHNDE